MAVLSDAQREAGWTIAKLGDIATLVMGTSPKSSDVVDYPLGIPLLNGPAEFTEKYPVPVKWTEKGIRFSEPGDILFCVRATLGKMNFSDRKYAIGRGLAAIRGIDELHTRYIYYTLLSTMESILRNANGTIYLSVTKSDVENFEIPLPPKDALKRIAGILGSLDDKIEANTRLIYTLSDYCVALVDSLKLFEGSRESTLGEIITFSPKVKKPDGEEYQFIDMSSLPTMGPVPETISSKNSWSGAKFENGDTLFARITPCLENGKTAIAMGLGDEPACGSTEFIVMRANTSEQVILPYGIARCDIFRQEAMSHMIGSTGRQRVKWQDLANIPVSVPSKSDMQKIEKSSDIFGYFEALRKENLQLAATRDALIKRLIG